LRVATRSFRDVLVLGVIGASTARAQAPSGSPPDRDPGHGDHVALAFWAAAVAGSHRALNDELRRNGFSDTGSLWPVGGLDVDVGLRRFRMGVGIGGGWFAPTTIRNAATGATATVDPMIAHADWGYEVYVGRNLAVYPVAGISFDGIGLTFDPNAAPVAPGAFVRYRDQSRVNVDAASFALDLGVGVEHFEAFAPGRADPRLGVAGVRFGMRAGYLWPFKHRRWNYQLGSLSEPVTGLPSVDLGGPYLLVSVGVAWIR
jgi:hypothetical protein